MSFLGEKTIWKLRGGVVLPYAAPESSPDSKISSENPKVPKAERDQAVTDALPLRRDADIYLSVKLDMDYVQNLITYLIRQGLYVGPFDEQHRFLEDDVVILKEGEQCPMSQHCHTVTDKRSLWEFLKQEFKKLQKS